MSFLVRVRKPLILSENPTCLSLKGSSRVSYIPANKCNRNLIKVLTASRECIERTRTAFNKIDTRFRIPSGCKGTEVTAYENAVVEPTAPPIPAESPPPPPSPSPSKPNRRESFTPRSSVVRMRHVLSLKAPPRVFDITAKSNPTPRRSCNKIRHKGHSAIAYSSGTGSARSLAATSPWPDSRLGSQIQLVQGKAVTHTRSTAHRIYTIPDHRGGRTSLRWHACPLQLEKIPRFPLRVPDDLRLIGSHLKNVESLAALPVRRTGHTQSSPYVRSIWLPLSPSSICFPATEISLRPRRDTHIRPPRASAEFTDNAFRVRVDEVIQRGVVLAVQSQDRLGASAGLSRVVACWSGQMEVSLRAVLASNISWFCRFEVQLQPE
ncbi:hypothetical protein B0H11DRAFT_2197735 [Mycena galericulata]|nr:hypothetical protein B0H11DRAFT_2197735 [Mycena galericulata]